MVVIPRDGTRAHTLWIFSGRACTGLFSRTQSVTQDTATVISGDVDPTECTNLAGPYDSFIAHPYTFTLFPGHLRTSPDA